MLSSIFVPSTSLPPKKKPQKKKKAEGANIYIGPYSNSLFLSLTCSQKVNIAELKEQLDEEKTKRKEEQEKAADDLKAAVHRAQSEAQEELKRLSDAALRRERELQEAINKLQV